MLLKSQRKILQGKQAKSRRIFRQSVDAVGHWPEKRSIFPAERDKLPNEQLWENESEFFPSPAKVQTKQSEI